MNELTANEREHANRDSDLLDRNKSYESAISDLALIQEIPDTDVHLTADKLRRIQVERNGVRYGIQEQNGPTTNGKLGRSVYAVGAELNGELQYPYHKGNCYGSFKEAIHALRKVVLHDPRQSDIPNHFRATHFSVSIPVPADD